MAELGFVCFACMVSGRFRGFFAELKTFKSKSRNLNPKPLLSRVSGVGTGIPQSTAWPTFSTFVPFMRGCPSERMNNRDTGNAGCPRCRLQLGSGVVRTFFVLQPVTFLCKHTPIAVRKLYFLWGRERSS